MKKIILALLVGVMAISCQSKKEVAINFVINDPKSEPITISISAMDTIIALDETGKASFILPIEEAQYGVMRYKWRNIPVYLEPGKAFTANWNLSPEGLFVTFEGAGADKNNYMNGSELVTPTMGDFGLAEDEFVAKMDKLVADNYAVLESKKFNKEFVEMEKHRINYMIYGILWQYARNGERSEAFYQKINDLVLDDERLMTLNEYSNYLQGAVSALANRGKDMASLDFLEGTLASMNYAKANLKSDMMKQYVIGMEACGYVAKEGVNKADEIKAMVEECVTNPEIKAAFDLLYAEGTVITKGATSPGFNYKDINGKEVSLESLRGKVVYIDLWATWCSPCRAEIPALQKLEEMFKGTNIAFVSISMDEDKAEWEKVVKGEGLGGIQLHNGGDEEFANAYQVQGIPRFILIDKEGKIIEANMMRPSDEGTIEMLSMYAE